jgi:hypothetical protein
MQKTQSKEFLKLSKTLEVPFKNPEFAPDGIATIWTGLRDKAVQMSNFHNEEAGVLKAGVISDLTRLRGDIKKHLSDLDKEGVQGSKKVGKKMDKFVHYPPFFYHDFADGFVERYHSIFGQMDPCCRNKSYLP